MKSKVHIFYQMQFDQTIESAYTDFYDDDEVAVIVSNQSDCDQWDSSDDELHIPQSDVETARLDIPLTPHQSKPYSLPYPHEPVCESVEPELARLRLDYDSSDEDLGFVEFIEEDPSPQPLQVTKRKPRIKTHKDECKSCKNPADRPNVLLTPRDFHNSRNYVTARYGSRHQIGKNTNNRKTIMGLPKSLCPSTRYGKEARVLSCKTTPGSNKQWKVPAEHPPIVKTRDQATMCETLKIKDTTEKASQIEPATSESSVQCVAATCDSSTQYAKMRRCHIGIQAPGVQHKSIGIQNTSNTKNTSTETNVSLMYYPSVAYGDESNYQLQSSTYNNGMTTCTIELRDDAHNE